MRLAQTSVIYFISKFIASIFGFVATIYFTRTLGEEVYGFYAITLALVSWLGIVKTVGFGEAIVKRMSEDQEPDEYLAAGTVIKTVLTTIVVVGTIIFRGPINEFIGQPVAEFVILLLIVSIVNDLVKSALKGQRRVHIYAPLSTVRKAAQSALMIALVYVGWELSGMLVGHALGTVIMSIIGLWIVKPKLVFPRWKHVVGLVDFAKYSWLGNMRKKTFSEADILILGLFVPAGLTGIYAVAYTLSEFLEIFGEGIRTTFFPEMSKLSAANDISLIATLTDDAVTFSGLLLIPGVVGASILGDRLMLLYGPNFGIGHWILVLLLSALLIYTYTKQFLNTLNAIDRPDLAFRANSVFIVVNIILNIILVWQIGWFGAALATLFSAMIGFVFSLYYVRQFITVSFPISEVGKQWIAAAIMGVVVLGMRTALEESGTWLLTYNSVFVIFLVSVGAAVYFAALVVLSKRLRRVILDNVPFDLVQK